MGRYISVTGHREPGSIRERTVIRHWDAVICNGALVRFRRRMAGKKRQAWENRRDIKRWAVVVAAEALNEWYAPVNAHTIGAMLDTEGMTVSRWYLNRALKDAGWLPAGSISLGYDVEYLDSIYDQSLDLDGEGEAVTSREGGRSISLARAKSKGPGFPIANWMPNPIPWGR